MKINIIKNPVDPEPVEIIAASIVAIAAAMKALTSTRLTRKAIVVLIRANTTLGSKTINLVLDNLESLERDWLKPAKP